jgi:hypothetical protein
MRKLLVAMIAVAALAIPTASKAQFQLGARVGYAIPMGDQLNGLAQSDWMSGAIPLSAELNYKFGSLTVGAYYGFGIGFEADALGCGGDCSINNQRVGVQLLYGFGKGAGFEPWLGVASGWEWLNTSDSTGFSFNYSGWEYVTFQVGADWSAAKNVNFGPYFSWGLGEYSSFSVDGTSGDIPSDAQGVHQSIQIGLRGAFNL